MSLQPSLVMNRLCVENHTLVNGNWLNQLQRWFIPTFATRQDQKVIAYFCEALKNILNGNTTSSDANESISLCERYLSQAKKITSPLASLEHHVLAAKQHLNPNTNYESEKSRCIAHRKETFSKWRDLGFSEEAFWLRPDLVDFIFKANLHRHITHPFFQHRIDTNWSIVRRNGEYALGRVPLLMMDGQPRPWSEICQMIHFDSNGRLYSMENGQKVHWMYLSQGLTRWDRNNFERPQCMKVDPVPPASTRLQIITTHIPNEDQQSFIHRMRKGVIHLFFRIHVGEGFAARNPHEGLVDGGLYSIGWGSQLPLSILEPLQTNLGAWNSPDPYEFIKQDFYITSIDIPDDKAVRLLQTIRNMNKNVHPFNIIGPNCCTFTAQLLSETGILSIDVKKHFGYFWAKMLLPKTVRKMGSFAIRFISSNIPECLTNLVKKVGGSFYSFICAPLFILVGARKVEVPNLANTRFAERIRPYYDKFLDIFNPRKAYFDVSAQVFKWQKRQPTTVFERHSAY